MTTWVPRLAADTPAYQALSDAIARAIEAGELSPGERLPTQRELADQLGVTLGTVTRGYALTAQLGLTQGEVGRGTFVRQKPGQRSPFNIEADRAPKQIDLSMNLPTPGDDPPLDVLLQGICRAAALPDLLSYQPPRGAPRHRRAGAKWLRRFGLACDEEEVLLCSGSQHALFLCLSLLCEPGATVLTEELTYPGFVAAAQALHLNVQGVELDEQGPTPDGLRAATKRTRSRVLYLAPTCQNPTTRTASRERRLALLTVAEQLDLQIIEDDLLSPLVLDAPPPLASLAPERVFFIASLSKLMAGGLRVAFLRPPVGVYERASERLAAIGWTTSPLNAELANALLESGEADVVLERRRLALGRRVALVHELLPEQCVAAVPGCYHAWLSLPPAWDADAFAAALSERGVLTRPASAFYVGRKVMPRAVRLSVSAAADLQQLGEALDRVRALLANGLPARQ